VVAWLKMTLSVIYFFFKFLPMGKKIVFMSRQSDTVPLDFSLLSGEILLRDPGVKIVFLCRRTPTGVMGYVRYFFTIIRQMFHMATSRICILDSYCIPVSLLTHKPSLFILQLWHAIGKIKQSGHQTIDHRRAQGWFDFENNPTVAKKMNMHANYDAIVAGAEFFNPFYMETFNATDDKLLNFGLPRIDYLINQSVESRSQVLSAFPQFIGKTVVLYAPTFKPYDDHAPQAMITRFLGEDVVLIVAIHPKQVLTYEIEETDNIYCPKEFSVIDLLAVSDYVVTDYSAICLEAAAISTPVLFFLPDHDLYTEITGLNLDPHQMMNSCCFDDVDQIYRTVMDDTYVQAELVSFRNNYLPKELGRSTQKIVDHLEKYWR